jgi:hypothetical protein
VQVGVIYDKVIQVKTNSGGEPPGSTTEIQTIHLQRRIPNVPSTGTPAPDETTADKPDGRDDGDDEAIHTREIIRFQLDSHLKRAITLSDIGYPSTIVIPFLGDDGIPRVVINQDILDAATNDDRQRRQ